jgi:hypothetical protein
MRFTVLTLVAFFSLLARLSAQDDLFGNLVEKKPARKGFVIGANGTYDRPGADMAERFGTSYRVGPSLFYKTRSNWMIGAKGDFIFGNRIREDSLMHNITTVDGAFIDKGGLLKNAGVFERGYMVGLQLGKIFSFGPVKSDKGLFVMTGGGFIQHRIRLVDKNGDLYQLAGEYKKGYDRLANGWFVEQFVGYNHFSANALINYHIGLNFMAGFTAGRRDYLYDVMRPGTDKRLDILFGLRGGWYIPMFRQKAEEIYY